MAVKKMAKVTTSRRARRVPEAPSTAPADQPTMRMDDFEEATYLLLNPDVREAVSSGASKSGFEHYLMDGQREGRSTKMLGLFSADRLSIKLVLANSPDINLEILTKFGKLSLTEVWDLIATKVTAGQIKYIPVL
jgi:hypothetical protein